MISSEVEVTGVYDWIKKRENIRKLFIKGGADSSKSYSIGQYFIFDKFFTEQNKKILVLRKTRVDCRDSIFELICNLLREYKLPFNLNKSELLITSIDGRENSFKFTGLDERNKFKSKEFNYIWMNEGTEYSFEDYLELVRRMRRKTDSVNQIILDYNPIDANSYLKNKLEDSLRKKNMDFGSFTLEDNPFAQVEDIEELEELKEQDENLYNVYRLGIWGILRNIIYNGWKDYPSVEKCEKKIIRVSYGIDWGFAKPATLVKVHWTEEDKVIWEELIYQTGLTIPMFVALAKKVVPEADRKNEFFGGTDEPGSIEEFYKAGFNIRGAITDVQDGINYCMAHLIGSVGGNLVKEAKGYKRMEDKNGNVLESPVKFMDHGMDGGRYGTYSAAPKPRTKIRVKSLGRR